VKVAHVLVEGFRSIRRSSVNLSAFQALIGPNSCGKSNFLRALEFFFESRGGLAAEDFYQDSTGAQASRILVEVTFSSLSESERSKFAKYLLGDGNLRVQKVALLENGELTGVEYHGIRRVPTDPRYRSESYIGTPTARFSALSEAVGPLDQFRPEGRLSEALFEQTLEAVVRARHESLEFEDAIEQGQFMGLRQVAAATLGRFLLLPAIPDPAAEGDVRKGSRLSELVSVVLERVTEGSETYSQAVSALRAAVSRFNATLDDGAPNPNRPADLPNLERELEAELSAWEVQVELEVPTPELDALVSRPTVHIDDGHRSSLQRKGHGLQRSFLLAALSVWRNHLVASPEGDPDPAIVAPVILAIEEPELYLHPQQQRILFELLKQLSSSGSTQVVLSSHSPIFIDTGDTTSILRTRKERETGTEIRQLAEPLFAGPGNQAKKARFHLTQWINPTRGELFFAKKVLLVEGPTEIAVIPFVANRLGVFKGTTAVIECGGKAAIPLYIELLKAFEIEFAVVYDEDPVTTLPDDEEHERDVQLFGLNRTIDVAAGDALRVRCIRPKFESLIGVSITQGRKKGKPLAALEALQSGQPVPDLEELVRWIYA
jgi:putative ATP-dependent endonuclease of the OLD family